MQGMEREPTDTMVVVESGYAAATTVPQVRSKLSRVVAGSAAPVIASVIMVSIGVVSNRATTSRTSRLQTANVWSCVRVGRLAQPTIVVNNNITR